MYLPVRCSCERAIATACDDDTYRWVINNYRVAVKSPGFDEKRPTRVLCVSASDGKKKYGEERNPSSTFFNFILFISFLYSYVCSRIPNKVPC